jgi:hypothetical protein
MYRSSRNSYALRPNEPSRANQMQSNATNEYAALKKALVRAGVSEEHLETLIRSETGDSGRHTTNYALPSIRSTSTSPSSSPCKSSWAVDAPVFVPREKCSKSSFRPDFSAIKAVHSIPPTPPSEWCDEEDSEPERFNGDNQDRSIVLRGFSPFTTLADLAKVLRGGIILNMYIREREREAHVSFVEPLAAEKFVMHYKRNDMYLKGKRIDVCWDDRQYYLPGYIRRQVSVRSLTKAAPIRTVMQVLTRCCT